MSKLSYGHKFYLASLILLLLSGCANRLSSTIAPSYQNSTTPVSSIGVTGQGANLALPAFVKRGYLVKDLGNDSNDALIKAANRNIPYVAIVDPVGTEGSWWDGFFDFSMRVTEVLTESIVWSGIAEYGQGGVFINQVNSTNEAMEDMVENFSKKFPPKSGKGEVVLGEKHPPSLRAIGTGFIISPDGHILTAHHAVSGAKEIFAHCTNLQSHAATLVKVDISNDLAVLHLSEPTPIYLQFAAGRSAKTGDKVFTMGFPVPDLLGQEAKYSEGVISALSGPSGAASFLQISIPVQPGNSGGPVLNQHGQVVGIVTAVASIQPFLQATGTLPQNVSWAVKAEYARLLFETHEPISVPTNPELIVETVRKSVCLIEAQAG